MPIVDSLKAYMIAARTDSAGVPKTDVDQEEHRILASLLMSQGYARDAYTGALNSSSFRVREDTGANMHVRVGNGSNTKRDAYILRGSVAGQGSYVVRMDAAYVDVTVPTTDAGLPQKYSVFLFVDDATYGGTAGRARVGLTCLRGTPAASPVAPSPDAAWSAYARLCTFELPAGASAVTNAILNAGSDDRVPSTLLHFGGPQLFTWSMSGVLSVAAGGLGFRAPIALELQHIRLSVSTAPTGADLIVDVNKNGTTVFTTQANRPKIVAGAYTESATPTPDVVSIAAGDRLTVDIDQIGSTVPGSNLVVVAYCLQV